MRRFRILVLVLGALVLSACRLDVKVNVAMNADGTGEVVVVATVDADVVNQVPGLAGSLRLDDATAAGWMVEGPTAVDGGGLTVTLRHPFASAAEASNLVNSLGPPFAAIVLDRLVTEDDITTTLTGALSSLRNPQISRLRRNNRYRIRRNKSSPILEFIYGVTIYWEYGVTRLRRISSDPILSLRRNHLKNTA